MNHWFADVPQPSFWNAPSGSQELFLKLGLALVGTIIFCYALSQVSPMARKWVVGLFVFLSGAFYVLLYLWPQPIARGPKDKPNGFVESVGFTLNDALPIVSNFSNILNAFLIGLGVYSLIRIHAGKVVKQQRDWGYSIVLLLSTLSMVIFGFWDWFTRKFSAQSALMDIQSHWGPANYGFDLLFYGLYQQMDAAMFSMIAFYILSAAYRAFRVRSIEATILLATALIVILSFMGLVDMGWSSITHGNETFSLVEIQKWLRDTFQKPAIRAIDFGVGVGALAMGLRLWLNLERQEAN